MKPLVSLCMVLSLQVLSCLANPVRACLWDSDTLADEAKGIPDVIRVITGRFERNPPLFYEMRLKRVADEIKSNPAKLEDYDDAGVACDRLGRDDAAIAWMDRKQTQLQRLNTADAMWREHQYHYLANIGTFYIHRWLRKGADRTKMGDVQKARDYIAQAIKLNPDAHFGREKYQLKVIDWILTPPRVETAAETLPNFLDNKDYQPYVDAVQAQKGICGLIVLGAGWESIDIPNVQHIDGLRNKD